jgi:hypothetical protein
MDRFSGKVTHSGWRWTGGRSPNAGEDLLALLRVVIKCGTCRMASRRHNDFIQMFAWAARTQAAAGAHRRGRRIDGNPTGLIESAGHWTPHVSA